ncbi:MAG: hypothetical protein ACI30B_04550 [Paludibacteraceae bacterium]
MKTIRLLFVLGFILTVFSCDKDDDVVLSSFDVVKETINPSYTTADIVCEFSTRATVKNVFVHYSKNADFSDYEEQKMIEKDGKFSASLSALQWNTTYYIRYAAKNSYSSAVTKKVSQAKTLEATVPTINIEQISNVLDKTASVRVVLVFDGGVAVSEYGVCLNSNATPTVDDYHVVAKNKDTIDISDLKANTTYRMRAYAKNEIGVGYSEQFSFTTLDLPKVRTDDFSDIQLFSVRLHATVVSTGNDTTAAFGFCWAEQTNPTIANNSTKVAVAKDTFSYLLSNLNDETKYYVRAYAKNKIGVVYGEEKSFTTQSAVKPTVSTTAATNISYTSVTVGGNVTSDGGAGVTERGVCYSTAQNPTTSSNKISSGRGTGSFSVSLTGLSDGITYYARAYAINSKGTSYGEQKTFTTKSYTMATVTTNAATNVSYTTAIVGGEVTSDGGTSVTERGVCYSTAQNPTTSNSKISSGSGTGSFSVSLTGLSDGTTYYVRAYAINSKGTSYGAQKSFTTQSCKATVTTSAATDISYTTATIEGEVTADGCTSVTERGVCYSTSQNPIITNNKVISGNGIGSFTCNLTDLQDGTIYYARAYATNSKGTSYGEQISFKTTSPYNGYEYVDLGLSVKWATCNVGATSPEECGDYFAWGETTTKTIYTFSNYKFSHLNVYDDYSFYTMTKYSTSIGCGGSKPDNDTVLDREDDAASVNMGGLWRMPTIEEHQELIDECTWTYTTLNGIKGCNVEGPSGNSIFLPNTGFRRDSVLSEDYSRYWSSSLYIDNCQQAYYLTFESSNKLYYSKNYYLRTYGCPIRGVNPY